MAGGTPPVSTTRPALGANEQEMRQDVERVTRELRERPEERYQYIAARFRAYLLRVADLSKRWGGP